MLLSPITVITYWNGHRVKQLSRTIKDNLAAMAICIEEKVGNIRTVKWFNQVCLSSVSITIRNERNTSIIRKRITSSFSMTIAELVFVLHLVLKWVYQ